MKRSISIIILLAMLLSLPFFSLISSATEANAADNEASAGKDVLSFSCVYNAESKKVTVSGTMNHDAFATYNNSSLVIYSIPPGMSEYEVAADKESKPLAETAVSIRFGFTFGISDLTDLYSRYAVFLRSEDGELTLGTAAQYAEVSAEVAEDETKRSFKGINTVSPSVMTETVPGMAVLQVYLDELYTSSSGGYVYQGEKEILFFEKNYIDELDSKINSLSTMGSKIYIQFLLRRSDTFAHSDSDVSEYFMPDVYDPATLSLVHGASDFIVSRYNGEKKGVIDGVIVGKGWDYYAKCNFYDTDDISEYAKRCGLYTVIIANAARSVDPTVDVVLPFTDKGFSTDAEYDGELGDHFSVKALAESILAYLDESFNSGLKCSFLIETAQTPFDITNDDFELGISPEFSAQGASFCAGKQVAFSSFLDVIHAKYNSVSDDYIFVWSVPENLSGNALAAAYTYSYYSLLGDTDVVAFVADFTSSSYEKDIARIIKYIDTVYGPSSTEYLLEYFGVNSWNEIAGITNSRQEGVSHIYTSEPMWGLPAECIGSFTYFDFSGTMLTENWKKGIGCKDIKIDYAHSERKALKASLAPKDGDAQVIYAYNYYENMIHTPYLKLDFELDGVEGVIYEVTFMLESATGRYESSCVVSADEPKSVVLDISEYAYFNKTESIKISVRTIVGQEEDCALWLYGISGHSEKYDSERLGTLIREDRDSIKDIAHDKEENSYLEQAAVAVGIVVAVGAVGIGVFVTLKRGGKNEEE